MPPSTSPPADRRLAAGLIVLAVAGAALIAWLIHDGSAPGPADAVTPAASPANDAPTIAAAAPEAAVRPAEWLPEAAGFLADEAFDPAASPGGADGGGTGDVSPAQRLAVVRGRVVDAEGWPVGGARVVLVPAAGLASGGRVSGRLDPDAFPNSVTGGEGRFEIEALHDRGRGGWDWPDVPAIVVLAEGQVTLGVPCAGFTGDDYDLGTVVTEPGIRLVGRVVDQDGTPIAGAEVTGRMTKVQPVHLDRADLSVASHFLGTSTGADGTFIADGFWPGRVQVAISSPGRLASLVSNLTLVPGTTADLGEIVLGRGAALSGRVVDAEGRPVGRAEVRVVPAPLLFQMTAEPGTDPLPAEWSVAGSDRRGARTRTDDDGRFTVRGLRGETASLWVAAPGHAIAARYGLPVDAADVVVTLPATKLLVVSVVGDEDHAPLEEPSVTVGQVPALVARHLDPTGRPGVLDAVAVPADLERAPTDVVLGPLSAGRWVLDVEAPGHEHRSMPVRIAGDAPVTRVEVALRPEARLRGRLVDEAGVAAVGVAVTAIPPPLDDGDAPNAMRARAWRAVQVRSDRAGRFSLAGLEPGEWILLAAGDGYGPVPDRQVEVVPSAVTDGGDWILPRESVIEGTLHDVVTGAPAAFRRVSIEGPVGVRHRALLQRLVSLLAWLDETHVPVTAVASDDRGHFRFGRLAPGSYELTSDRGATATVEVAAGAVARTELWMRRPPHLHGRVTAAGAPVEGATVVVHTEAAWWDGAPSDAGAARTDASGAWQAELPSVGACRLVAALPSGAQLVRAGYYLWDADVIEDFAFGGLVIEGTVLSADDHAPVPGAAVHLQGNGGLSAFTASNDAGRFRLTGLEPDHPALVVTAPGYRNARLDAIDLATGLPAPDVEVLLAVSTGIVGRVTGVDGRPAPDGLDVVIARGPRDCLGSPCVQARGRTSQGRYALFDLAPGDYQLSVLGAGTLTGRPARDPFLVRRDVHLAPATHAHVDLFLEREP